MVLNGIAFFYELRHVNVHKHMTHDGSKQRSNVVINDVYVKYRAILL